MCACFVFIYMCVSFSKGFHCCELMSKFVDWTSLLEAELAVLVPCCVRDEKSLLTLIDEMRECAERVHMRVEVRQIDSLASQHHNTAIIISHAATTHTSNES